VLLQGGVSTGRDSLNACAVTAQVPELLLGAAGGNQLNIPAFTGAGFNLGSVWLSPDHCAAVEKMQTQGKFIGMYTIPKIDLMVSGTYQNMPGPALAANFVASNALVSPSLGRALSGGAPNTTIDIVQPGTFYGDRINQLDLRFSKILRAGRTKAALNLDVANALNSDAVVTELFGYNPSNPAAWRRPNELLMARFLKIGVNFDF
jgi:hypothetical protein